MTMPIAETSLSAHERLQGSMNLCSWRAGWRSLLLRGYDEPEVVEDLVTAPTEDQLIVLVTQGNCLIEGWYVGRWQAARYGRGAIGMTAPGEAVRLRWREGRGLQTLQLHLPAATLADVTRLDPASPAEVRLPNQLMRPDPVIEAVLLGLDRAAREGAAELYADTAVHFLASHLLRFHSGTAAVPGVRRDDRRMARVDALLREKLASTLTLADLAAEAGLSKFHLLRAFKETYGETPGQRLTRYRMEKGRHLLGASGATVSVIAYACGYENPSHFATAFRRTFGISPTRYRKELA
ncbi:AraC family transcriptional regulator [Inquilinus limosus]|uniref:helix-turn-helix transcriptional regulator n=1 Tax=Inquilinus limosus TaxID=171674 RepID=UPI003F18C457